MKQVKKIDRINFLIDLFQLKTSGNLETGCFTIFYNDCTPQWVITELNELSN